MNDLLRVVTHVRSAFRLRRHCLHTYSPDLMMKRAGDHAEPSTSKKQVKLAPIFSKVTIPSDAPFQWQPAVKGRTSLLHGIHLAPTPHAKVAAFDLDSTLIEGSYGGGAKGPGSLGGRGKGKGDPLAWRWWRPVVPRKLKQLVDEGWSIVIVSNQGIGPDKLDNWKKKIPLIASAQHFLTMCQMPEVPFHIFAATGRDQFRKPMPGTWFELCALFARTGVIVDKTESFFVGDAAGRSGDWANTDRKWAENAGLKFYTPEEYFLGLLPAPYSLTGFHPSSLPVSTTTASNPIFAAAPVTPSAVISEPLASLDLASGFSTAKSEISTPETTLVPITELGAGPGPPVSDIPMSHVQPEAGFVQHPSSEQELVLFVGPPAIGKTTYFHAKYGLRGYIRINQDTMGSRQKCLAAAEAALGEGKSVVVDNTNRDCATRAHWIALARKVGITVKLVHFTAPVALARHNNLYRAFFAPPPPLGADAVKKDATRREVLPEVAFTSYVASFEEPKLEEGFESIENVNWEWSGSEEEKKLWSMWLVEK